MRGWLGVAVFLLSLLPPCHAWSSSPSSSSSSSRKAFLQQSTAAAVLVWFPAVEAVNAKCTDIESCREIGERKDAENLANNPITKLGNGLQYRTLAVGTSNEVIKKDSTIQIIFSISQGNGSYMYSRGFGFNKIDAGNGRKVNDYGLDTLSVEMGSTAIPVGIQTALLGAKRGERRRIECPAKLGFETSNWEPKPATFRGERQMIDYRNTLSGRGGGLPFPAPTVWDVEVVSIR